jgi:hypothetical protein
LCQATLCTAMAKSIALPEQYAFGFDYYNYGCDKSAYKNADKNGFQTAMNTRYGTSGCLFRVVRLARVDAAPSVGLCARLRLLCRVAARLRFRCSTWMAR